MSHGTSTAGSHNGATRLHHNKSLYCATPNDVTAYAVNDVTLRVNDVGQEKQSVAQTAPFPIVFGLFLYTKGS